MVSRRATTGRRKIYYPRPIASLPDILMLDGSALFPTKRHALKRFHPIIVETIEEQSELEALVARETDALSHNPLNQRPSMLARGHLTIAHYGPPEPGWPYVQLCQWPAEFAARATSKNRLFARRAYTFELFQTRQRLEKASAILLESLDQRHALHVEIVFPDWSADADSSPN